MHKIPFLLGIFVISSLCAGATITVSLDGTSDYTTIQAAIDNSIVGDKVIVLQGTYNENIYFRGKTITLTSTNPDDPNTVSATIIDGGGNDSVVTFDGTETACCVMTGFLITGGNSASGGGISGNGTNASLKKCTITNNTADYNGGGIAYCDGVIDNCTINCNSVTWYGGGLSRCEGTITSCTIAENTADNYGGGLYGCQGTISNCTITKNTAHNNGGGLHTCGGNVSTCRITFNVAEGRGGGIYDSDGIINNCLIQGNTAHNNGGGIYGCDGTIGNCVIMWNMTNYKGGGLFSCEGSIHNCTITHNTALNKGGGIYCYYDNLTITNCILWDNTPDELFVYNSTLLVSYSDIKGDWEGIGNIDTDPLFVDAENGNVHLRSDSPCIDRGDPDFAIEEGDVDIDGEPRVEQGRIDIGADEVYIDLYIRVWPKYLDFFVYEDGSNPENQDLTIHSSGEGILEWNICEYVEWLDTNPKSGESMGEEDVVTVSVDTTTLEPGQYNCEIQISSPEALNSPQTVETTLFIRPDDGILTVPEMFQTIQSAINTALNGDTVIVNVGLYKENINFRGKNITLTSTNPDDPNVVATTIIDGGGNDSVVKFDGSETACCVMTGLSITGGNAVRGGGIYGNGSDATISNCSIYGNKAYECSGGLDKCDGKIEKCIIKDNIAGWSGGGLWECNGVISNCTITGNSAYYNGGGLINCEGMIDNCKIANNRAKGSGGGMFGCNGEISCCLITDNTSKISGGGLSSCYATISNCEIKNNTANNVGGGLAYCDGTIRSCTISNNAAGRGGGLMYCGGNIDNCTITSNTAEGSGGGLQECHGTVSNCSITCNEAYYYGGGLRDCDGTISGCRITGNASGYGGGLQACNAKISYCVINGNTAIVDGGGLASCNAEISNCLIAANTALNNGGGLYVYPSGTISHCTITDNIAGNKSGRIYCYYGNPIITNCILWRNTPNGIDLYNSTPTVTFCNIENGWEGAGNIDLEPIFVEDGYWEDNGTPDDISDDVWVGGDYHLQEASPCIDTGDPNYVIEPDETDLDGNERIVDGNGDGEARIDMGAYEYIQPAVVVPVDVEITPNVLSLNSKGEFVVAHITIPEDVFVTAEVIVKAMLDGQIEAVEVLLCEEDTYMLTVKFDRTEVSEYLNSIGAEGQTELAITIELADDMLLEGRDTIKILSAGL